MEQMLARPRFFEVSKILTILRLFLINMLLIKKKFKFAELIILCSEKLDQSKYSQKLMSWNTKAKIFEY